MWDCRDSPCAVFTWAAGGLSGLLRGCRKAGPAGLRGLLKSPPHLAGQASAPLRGSLVNPCRDSWPFIVWDCRDSSCAVFTWAAKALPGGVALRAENWVYLWEPPLSLLPLKSQEKRLMFLSTRSSEIAPLLLPFTGIHVRFLHSIEELLQVFQEGDILMAHNTNQIVPKSILQKASLSVNVHAGPPEFPGRDPHHWAVYFAAAEYGVTAHLMEERVDAGAIVEVLRFPIEPTDSPISLLIKANKMALVCIVSLLQKIHGNQTLVPLNETWSDHKTSRKDFLEKCDVSKVLNDQDEMKRRIQAFQVHGHQNLYFTRGNERVYLPTDVG